MSESTPNPSLWRRWRGPLLLLGGAAAAFLTMLVTSGFSIWLPSSLVAAVLPHPAPVLLVPHVLLPLVFVAAPRWDWWVRWPAAGVLLFNIGLLVYLQVRSAAGGGIFYM